MDHVKHKIWQNLGDSIVIQELKGHKLKLETYQGFSYAKLRQILHDDELRIDIMPENIIIRTQDHDNSKPKESSDMNIRCRQEEETTENIGSTKTYYSPFACWEYLEMVFSHPSTLQLYIRCHHIGKEPLISITSASSTNTIMGGITDRKRKNKPQKILTPGIMKQPKFVRQKLQKKKQWRKLLGL